MISPHAALAAAYVAAAYRLEGYPRIGTLRIGARHPRLDRRLRALGCRAHWQLLTACNPQSQQLTARDNARRLRALADVLARQGWRCLPACAAADDGSWAEPGWCLLDADPAIVNTLARHCGQAARVMGRLDGPAELIWLQADSTAR